MISYGYIVKYGNVNNIEAKVTFKSVNGFTSSVTGTTTYPPQNGVVKIDNLVLTAAPGTNQTIEIQSKDLRNSSVTQQWQVSVRNCKEGNYI